MDKTCREWGNRPDGPNNARGNPAAPVFNRSYGVDPGVTALGDAGEPGGDPNAAGSRHVRLAGLGWAWDANEEGRAWDANEVCRAGKAHAQCGPRPSARGSFTVGRGQVCEHNWVNGEEGAGP